MAVDQIARSIGAKSKQMVESIISTGGILTLTFLPVITLPSTEDVKLTNIGTDVNLQMQLEIPRGKNGQSSYELALQEGFVGTVQDYLLSLAGKGIPAGGKPDQILVKVNGVDYNTKWADLDLSNYYTKTQIDNLILTTNNKTTGVLFLAKQNGNPVLTHIKPTHNQQIVDRVWINANWGEWTEVVSFAASDDVIDKEVEFIPGNRFFAKLWLSSDVARPNTQLRMEITDKNDDALLAVATTTVNLLNINTILTPAVFENKYQELRVLPLSQIKITISAMVLEQGMQFGIISNIPNEISYISPTSTIEPDLEEDVIYHSNLSTVGKFIEVPIGRNPESRVLLKYHCSIINEISLQIKAEKTNVLVDVKRSSQWSLVNVEGSSLDNITLTNTYQNLDLNIYTQSSEMHRMWIRIKNKIDEKDLWSLFEVCLFCSASGARTDIWVHPIYENKNIAWN